ncbi:helix-turn-helix transcriptional regulator [Paenibacillaceae bacterium WGS1546]|uniref:helix-turn-helix transcriptional regulator n=1 Tax=Cohnella sp. WGS1546 TaxID=3366810 RepID=UPI00372D5EEE
MKAVRFFKPNFKMLLVSCSVVTVVIVFSLFLSREYSRVAMEDVAAIAQSKMSHIAHNTSVTLDHLRIYGMSIYQDKSVESWLVAGNSDPIADFSAFSSIRKYQSLQPFIANIVMINYRTERIVDAGFGASPFADFADKLLIVRYSDYAEKYLQYGTYDSLSGSYITMALPDSKKGEGILLILFDRDSLEQFLFQNDSALGFSIRLTDETGELLMGDSAPPSGNHVAKLPLEGYNWVLHFSSDRAELTRNIGAFQRKLTIAASAVIAILLAIILYGWIKTFGPFRRLARELQSKLGNVDPPGRLEDSEIIRSGFEYLLDSVEQMNMSLRNYRDIAKEQYLRQWILQGSESHLRGILIDIGVLPKMACPRVAIIRIESYKLFSDEYNYQSRKLLKYAMGNISCEVGRLAGFDCEAVDMDGDHYVLLIADQGATDSQSVIRMLEEVQSRIGEFLKTATAIAVSGRVESVNSLRKCYEETYDLTMLKFLTGEPRIYEDSDLEQSFQSAKTLPDDSVLEELVRAVKQSDSQRMRERLGKLVDGLRGLTIEELNFQLRMIVYTLFKSFSKVIDLQEETGAGRIVNRFSSLSEMTVWLESRLASIMNNQKSKPEGNRKDEIGQEIIDYIRNHLQDPSLSLDSISDHLGLSSSYVRHVFKDVHQITLADYLMQERLRKVKELLLTTDLTIAEIAESAGFLTKSHFYSAFKKSEGITPAQYRNRVN